jgi:glucosyl-3-phosphoglycerate phosphatase
MVGNRIVIWRHGQTDWNKINRFQGHSDIALNEVGKVQVTRAAQVLAGMNPTQIIASDLGRAKETAQALADLTGLGFSSHESLRETNGGLWEGKTGSQNRAEDFHNFIRWIDRAVGEILKALEGKTEQLLVVATHGGTARCVLGELLQLPLSHWGVLGGLSNASWSVLQRNPRQWNLVEHNAGSIPEPVYGEESGATFV